MNRGRLWSRGYGLSLLNPFARLYWSPFYYRWYFWPSFYFLPYLAFVSYNNIRYQLMDLSAYRIPPGATGEQVQTMLSEILAIPEVAAVVATGMYAVVPEISTLSFRWIAPN